jgi:thiazole synthase
VAMAQAFGAAVQAGRLGFEAGMMQASSRAHASSPTVGLPFWHQEGAH